MKELGLKIKTFLIKIKKYTVAFLWKINRPSLRTLIRRQQDKKTKIKFNIGCGINLIKGWFNLDNGDMYGLFGEIYFCDIKKHFNIPNNTVDVIYISHTLEHLESWEARFFLQECHRILKIGGIIRIVVPDLDILYEKFIQKDEAFFTNPIIAGYSKEEIENYFNQSSYLTFSDLFLGVFYSSEFFRRTHSGFHKYIYNKEILFQRLKSAGFDKIFIKKWGESLDNEIKEFELNRGSAYKDFSIYVEAIK